MKVGLVLPLLEAWPPDITAGYGDLRALAQLAEATGFDSVWLSDHLLFRHPNELPTGSWEAWTLLSALAEATSRVHLGTMVLSAGFRNPGLLAKMATTLDEVSAGRLILGLGAGSHEPEYRAFGFPFAHRVDRFDEYLRVLLPLLREEHVRFSGRWYQLDAELRPHGPRKGRIPVLIAAGGPRMIELAARHGDAWSPAGFDGPPKALRRRIQDLTDACVRLGRDPASIEVTAGLLASVDVPSGRRGGAVDAPGVTPRVALSGPPHAMAAGLAEHAAAGVQHAMINVRPATVEAVAVVAEAVALFRSGSTP